MFVSLLFLFFLPIFVDSNNLHCSLTRNYAVREQLGVESSKVDHSSVKMSGPVVHPKDVHPIDGLGAKMKGYRDKMVTAWRDARTAMHLGHRRIQWKRKSAFIGHEDSVWDLESIIWNDQELLASCSADGSIRFWDPNRLLCVGQLNGHGGSVNGIAFHWSLPIICSGSGDWTCRVWVLPGVDSFSTEDTDFSSSFEKKRASIQQRRADSIEDEHGMMPEGKSRGSDEAMDMGHWEFMRDRSSSMSDRLGPRNYFEQHLHQRDVSISTSREDLESALPDDSRSPGDSLDQLDPVDQEGRSFSPWKKTEMAEETMKDGAQNGLKDVDANLTMPIGLTKSARFLELKGHTSPVSSVQFSSVLQAVASCSWDGSVRLWSLWGREQKNSVPCETLLAGGRLTCVTCHTQTPIVAASRMDGYVNIWDPRASHRPTSVINAHSECCNCTSFFPSVDQWIASAGDDKNFRLWDLRFPKTPVVSHRSSSAINRFSISKEGTHIALALDRRRVEQLNAQGQLIGTLVDDDEGHELAITKALWGLDGASIYTSSHDMTIQSWEIDTSNIK
eukprot:TRINITY_DN3225_c0_g2_i6.p1 TRINITY_DN3225_c0_g2~~TRINITY_DN3225_c0_g2_i6.p1  ORF type:complete len:560 (+),score=140.72 TRINITY_DN3225_c0_g2_i6:191-1870(+)